MKLLVIFSIVVIISCHLYVGQSRTFQIDDTHIFNVLDFKSAANGSSDDTNALAEAWGSLCKSKGKGSVKLVIPKNKTFLVKPMRLEGPCTPSLINIQIEGKIIAPGEPQKTPDGCWLCFLFVDNLLIDGSGTFDAKGEVWWKKGVSAENRPSALGFHGCKNLQIKGTTHLNSPRSHIEVQNCNNATISYVNINAPKDSPNTDGVVIAQSKHVNVLKSNIATGDDCIAIKNGSSDINAFDVKCGPGHGISVGSLGVGGALETVENVHVRGCSFTNSLNGARVKTWAGGAGYARNIVFENITLSNTGNPIIIDQHYCNGPHTCADKGKAVEVSNVTFKSFYGTSATQAAITLDCSKSKPCSNIRIEHINITLASSSSYSSGKAVNVTCNNAHGTTSGLISPSTVPCFNHSSPPPSHHEYFM